MYECEDLMKKYNQLQRIIYRVINDYRDEEFVDDIDRLEWTEEEFASEFFDFIVKILNKEDKI